MMIYLYPYFSRMAIIMMEVHNKLVQETLKLAVPRPMPIRVRQNIIKVEQNHAWIVVTQDLI